MFSSKFLRAASRSARPTLSRSFRSTPVRAAATGTNDAVKKDEEQGIIEKYGVLPFVGLGMAALVGKEAFIINEEFMLAINTCAFVFTAYVAVGDGFAKTVEEANAATSQKYHKAVDAVTDAMTTYKGAVQAKLDSVDVMREFIEEQDSAARDLVDYTNIKVRHAAYGEMMAKLGSIKGREDAEAAAEFTELVNSVCADVNAAYTGSDAATLKNEALLFAMDNIGKKPSSDPVSALFVKSVEKSSLSAPETI